jgi:hypothetical protein
LMTDLNYLSKAKVVEEILSRLSQIDHDPAIHAAIFVRAARVLEHIYSGQGKLLSLVTPDGQVRWKELLEILPKNEQIPVTIHPKIRLSGTLPAHLPIGRIERVKTPLPGITLATESGFTLHIGTEIPILIQIVWDQLEALTHPTWNELVQYLRVPRRTELAESTALDVLRSHEEQAAHVKEVRQLLGACQLFSYT